MDEKQVTLTDAEAEELWRYMRYDYLSPNTYPALNALSAKLSRWAEAHGLYGIAVKAGK